MRKLLLALMLLCSPASAQVMLGGNAAPVNSSGSEGQFYLNFTTGQIYGPKAFGAWGASVATLTTPAAGSTGQIQYNSGGSFAGAAGLTTDGTALTITGGTVTTSAPVFNATQTWNAGGVTFNGLLVNITDTASATASTFIDFQVAGSSKFSINKSGAATSSGGFIVSGTTVGLFNNVGQALLQGSASSWGSMGSSAFALSSTTLFGWSNGTTAGSLIQDTYIRRSAAATIALGSTDAASPVAQTLSTQGSRAGTDSNVGGANLTIQSGNGTGTGTLSTLILRSPVAVGSGTGAQTMTTGLTIRNGTAVVSVYTVATLPTCAAGMQGAKAMVTDANATTFWSIVAAGGANIVPVTCDQTNWRIG